MIWNICGAFRRRYATIGWHTESYTKWSPIKWANAIDNASNGNWAGYTVICSSNRVWFDLSPTYTMWQYNAAVSFWSGFVYMKESNRLYRQYVSPICLRLLAEWRRNDYVETKWSCGLHIRLGTLFKRVAALGRIHCFCLFTSGKRCTAGARDNEFSTLHRARTRANKYYMQKRGYLPL